jgi:hypothetical protein
MSYDKNMLKYLLSNLLDKRLKRLEKKNIDEDNDLKYTKIQFQKQEKLLNLLSNNINDKKINNRKISFNDSLYNKSELIKHKGSQNSKKFKLSPKYSNKNNNYRNALTPSKSNCKYFKTTENWTKKRTNKYNYVKSRYMEETNNMHNIASKKNEINRKLWLTPEPHIKKKKKINKNNIQINFEPKKLNLGKINIKNTNNDKNLRKMYSLKREQDKEKNTIVSQIDLGEDEITFVLKELRKEKIEPNSDEENEDNYSENKNSDNSTSNSNSNSLNVKNQKTYYIIKNNETIKLFGNFISSSEGKNIALLISSFLDKKTKYKFFSSCKRLINLLKIELNKIYNDILKANKINSFMNLNNKINDLKKKFINEDFEEIKYAFKISDDSKKALEILDDIKYNDIFKKEDLEPPLNNIIIIYRIFFQLIDKEELIEIENDKKFWNKTRNYILENNQNKLGTFIKEYSSEFDFTKENIYKVKKLVAGYEDKLKPTIFEDICKTTGLIAFIIKDALEYSGLIPNDNKMMPKIVINYLIYVKEILNHCKEYIDFLK